jgi:hypothetical protein
VYFIDDLNMPYVDKYNTQSAIELARQMVDYRGWWGGEWGPLRGKGGGSQLGRGIRFAIGLAGEGKRPAP